MNIINMIVFIVYIHSYVLWISVLFYFYLHSYTVACYIGTVVRLHVTYWVYYIFRHMVCHSPSSLRDGWLYRDRLVQSNVLCLVLFVVD